MKKTELVYLEILNSFEKGIKKMTQALLAEKLDISLSTVNHALAALRKMGAINIHKNGFFVVNAMKILYLLASIRNIEKDIIYKTRAEISVREIEKSMPSDIVYGGYSAYKLIFNNLPADYSEVYVYSGFLEEIKRRFPEKKGPYNLFVLKKDIKDMSLALLFVDFWNLKEWYAKEFLNSIEKRIKEVFG